MDRPLPIFQALLPLLTMTVCLLVGARYLPMDANLLVPVMLVAAGVAGLVAVSRGHSFDEIQQATAQKLAGVLPMLLILLAIGMLVGSWMLGGTIPVLIYYGLQMVDPGFMVLTAFLVTATMSLATGTSWGSAGTVGVALIGMAGAMGTDLAMCAGAVLSGAYFGDKLSPLSDSTNICALSAGADLYDHIRNLLYTSVPSFSLALVVYLIAGLTSSTQAASSEATTQLLRELEQGYHLNLWTLLPPLIIIVGIIRKTPPVLAMTASSLVALLIGMSVHGFDFGDALGAAVNGFRVDMFASLGLDPTVFSQGLVKLVNRGGLYSMVPTFLLIIAAFLLAAGLEVSGSLDRLVKALLGAARGIFGLIAATMTSGALMISLTSHGGVTALVIGDLFQNAFRSRGLAPANLSRCLEDSVTITEPLMPWTVSAIFMAGTLGVPTVDYAPWAVFCYGGPIFSLLIAATYKRTKFGLKPL